MENPLSKYVLFALVTAIAILKAGEALLRNNQKK